MKYMLMINIPAEALAAQPTGSQQKMNDAYRAFNEKLIGRNALAIYQQAAVL